MGHATMGIGTAGKEYRRKISGIKCYGSRQRTTNFDKESDLASAHQPPAAAFPTSLPTSLKPS